MKKANIVLMFVMSIVVAVSGYFIFFSAPTYDYQTYTTRKNELLTASSYSDYSSYFTLDATSSTLSNGKYSIVVTIREIVQTMDEVEVLLISGNELTLLTDTLYPSKNILTDDSFNLVPEAVTNDDSNRHGINLNFISLDPVTEVYIYIAFLVNDLPVTLYIRKVIS